MACTGTKISELQILDDLQGFFALGVTEQGANGRVSLQFVKNNADAALQAATLANQAASNAKSAYQIWLENGNSGTEDDFLNSLIGDQGEKGEKGDDGEPGVDGKSAYQIWLDEGGTGTEEDFLNSLKGEQGETGPSGSSDWGDIENKPTGDEGQLVGFDETGEMIAVDPPEGVPNLSQNNFIVGGASANEQRKINLLDLWPLLKDAIINTYAYGVVWDTSTPSSSSVRVGNMDMHRLLPIQSKMRRCLLSDDGTVNYYTGENSTLVKEDNVTASVLDGADGMVMVEIPEHYFMHETKGGFEISMTSEIEIPGFTYVPKMYVSAYEAAVDRTVPATPKLASVVNATANFRGGNNTDVWDGSYRSQLGHPATNISLANFRAYARNRGAYGLNGAGWNGYVYNAHKALFWLYAIEYASMNSQLAYNASPDGNGYKQGGLGDGVTTLLSSTWSSYNGQNPVIPCGITNSLGNKTGSVDFTLPVEYGTLTVGVPSYRGVENPFGHVWKWTDGLKCRIQADGDGGLSEFYTCDNPANYQSTNYANYVLRGLLPRESGYIKNVLFGEFGDVLPREVGGSSSTYFADNFSTNIPASGEAERGVRFGGHASDGALAGLACVNASGAPSGTDTRFGSRLCFIPAT